MAFTPEINPTNDPNYLGASRAPDKIEGNTGLGKLFSNLSELGGEAFKAVDTGIKEVIKYDLYEKIDDVRAKFGVDDGTQMAQAAGIQGQKAATQTDAETIFPTGPKGSARGAPPGVEKLGAKIGRLGEAYKQGQLSDSYYYANLEAVVKEARNRYPGYREEIDSMVSTITGVTPANALRKSLLSDMDAAAKASSSAASAYNKYLIQHGPEVIQALGPAEYKAQLEGQGRFSQSQVITEAGTVKANNAIIEQEKNRLGLTKAQNEDSAGEAKAVATSATTQAVTQVMNRNFINIEGETKQALPVTISNIIKSGKPIDGPTAQVLTQAVNKMELEAETAFNTALDQPLSRNADGSARMSDTLRTRVARTGDMSQIEAIRTNAMAPVAALKKAIGLGDAGLMHQATVFIQASKNYTGSQIIAAHPTVAAAAGLGAVLPTNTGIPDAILSKDNYAILPDIQKTVIDLNNQGMRRGVMTLGQAVDQNVKAGQQAAPGSKPNKDAINLTIATVPASLADPKVSNDEKVKLVDSAFGSKNSAFWGQFANSASAAQAFGVLTSPEVTKNVSELAKTADPTVIRKYQAGVIDGFGSVYNQVGAELQSLVTSGKYNVSFDPKTLEATAVLKPEFQTRLSGGAIDKSRPDPNQVTVDRFNIGMRNLSTALKVDGGDPGPKVMGVISKMGVDFGAEKTPSIWGIAGKAIAEAGGKLWSAASASEGKLFSPPEVGGKKSGNLTEEKLLGMSAEEIPAGMTAAELWKEMQRRAKEDKTKK